MLLFLKVSGSPVSQMVIPMDRVYNIWVSDCSVNVNYDGGELIEVEGKYLKKIEIVTTKFSSESEAQKIIRQFYKAAKDGSNVFFIGAS